jgi:hypothetical protein
MVAGRVLGLNYFLLGLILSQGLTVVPMRNQIMAKSAITAMVKVIGKMNALSLEVKLGLLGLMRP